MLAIIWRVYYFLYFLLIKFISLLIWVVNKSYFIFRALSVWTAHHGHPPTEMKILKGLFGCCWKYFIPRPDADWECFGLRKIWTDYYSKCFLVRNRWNEAGIGFLGKNTKTSFTKKKNSQDIIHWWEKIQKRTMEIFSFVKLLTAGSS